MKILITGASGYIGKNLALHFANMAHRITVTVRTHQQEAVFKDTPFIVRVVPDLLNASIDLVKDHDVLIYAAGRAHKNEISTTEAERMHLKDNFEAPLHLAHLCKDAGVKRLIVISSIGASLLENDLKNSCVTMEQAWNSTPYRASKLQADNEILKLLPKNSPTQGIVVRLPILYGKNAPGNFSLLSQLVEKRVPLPIYGIKNKRSFISISTLCSFIEILLAHPNAAERIWEIRDLDEVSTPYFVRALASALGAPCPLFFPFPPLLLRFIGKLFGIKNATKSLIEDLHINLAPVKKSLNWIPPFGVKEGLDRALKI